MKCNVSWRGLRSIGTQALTGGLIALTAQAPGILSLTRADDLSVAPSAAAQLAAWNQGVLSAEIAWLANPATFHEHLSAAIAGDFLEIRGTVSNEAARSLAMRLAREASRMPVVDRMETAVAPALASPDRSLNMIYRDSVQALYHGCPQLSRGLTVSTLDRGEVVVRGEVPTLEDKLTVSRCLQSVAGCNCVKNQVRTKTGTVAASNVAASKPPIQDNGLLARLGLVKPRTEVPASSQAVVYTYPTREALQPASVKPELVALPTAPPTTSLPHAHLEFAPEIIPVSASESRREGNRGSVSPVVEPIALTPAAATFETGKLRRAIAETCGISESAVRVVSAGAKALTISMAVPDVEMGKNLAAKVLAMPELVPFGVSLNVSIAR